MIWKEVRCDGLMLSSKCWNMNNDGPKGFEGTAELHRQARRAGWLVKGKKAFCPICRNSQNA